MSKCRKGSGCRESVDKCLQHNGSNHWTFSVQESVGKLDGFVQTVVLTNWYLKSSPTRTGHTCKFPIAIRVFFLTCLEVTLSEMSSLGGVMPRTSHE